MRTKIVLFAAILSMPLMFAGWESGMAQEVNKQKLNQTQSQEIEKKNYADNGITDYEIIRAISEDKDSNTKIFYPQITGYKGQLLMDYMNQSLKKIVNIYGKKDVYKDISIDYKITKMDNNIISVLFKGTGKISGGRDITIQQSVNLDIKSSNEIVFENFIKGDQASRDEVRSILNEKANAIGLKDEIEAESMRIYFEEENVVFYYMPLDDSTTNFIEISVNKNELDGLLNTDFGERPAS